MHRLPGDPPAASEIASMIRVDHAGEYGAMRIYAGQQAFMRPGPGRKLVEHMAAQERHHLKTFETLVKERKVRPTFFMPLWHVAGYALGAATALMGERAAFACTVAVESVIQDHYGAQEMRLKESEAGLARTIAGFRADEKEHHDASLDQGAEHMPLYSLFSATVKAASKAAIRLSETF